MFLDENLFLFEVFGRCFSFELFERCLVFELFERCLVFEIMKYVYCLVVCIMLVFEMFEISYYLSCLKAFAV